MGLLDPTDAALLSLGAGLLGGGSRAQAMGRGAQGFMSTYQAAAQAQAEQEQKARELAMQEEIKKAQIANYLSEARARDQNLITDKALMGLLSGGAPIGSTAAPADGVGPMQSQAPLQIGVPPVGVSSQGGPVSQMTPEQLAMFKLRGKDLTDIHKMTRPDWQISNGYRWDKNAPDNSTGFMPSASTSSNGQSTMFVPDGKGGVSVVVPQGAGAAFSEFQNREQEAKARYEPFTYRPTGSSTPVLTTKEQFAKDVQRANAPQDISTNLSGDPATVRAQIIAQTRAAGMPQEQTNAILAAYEKQVSGGRGVAVQSEEEKKFAEGRASSGAKTMEDMRVKAESAASALPTLYRASDLLSKGLFTGLGSDAKMNIVRAFGAMGIPIPDAVANSQSFDADMAQVVGQNLKAIAGSTNISNADLAFVKDMFGTRGMEPKALSYLLNKFIEANERTIQTHRDAEMSAPGGPGFVKPVDLPKRQSTIPRIKGQPDFDALESGQEFIDPFGKTRRKP